MVKEASQEQELKITTCVLKFFLIVAFISFFYLLEFFALNKWEKSFSLQRVLFFLAKKA